MRGTSRATVKTDVALLRHQRMFIMAPGTKHDMGPGLSHNSIILDLYSKRYTFTEIERQTNHSESSVKRYPVDFVQVTTPFRQSFSPQQIRLSPRKSDGTGKNQTMNASRNCWLQAKQDRRGKNPELIIEQEVGAMSEPLTKELIQLNKCGPLKSKNVQQLLLYRFLNHYGYNKAPVTAKAVIDDILKLVDDYFLVSTLDDLRHVHYGQLVRMADPSTNTPSDTRPWASRE